MKYTVSIGNNNDRMKLEANLFSLIFLAVWPYLVGSAGGSWVWCQRLVQTFVSQRPKNGNRHPL
jgi:hypothetical protein